MERASSSDEDKQEIGLQFDAELDNMQIETRPNIDGKKPQYSPMQMLVLTQTLKKLLCERISRRNWK